MKCNFPNSTNFTNIADKGIKITNAKNKSFFQVRNSSTNSIHSIHIKSIQSIIVEYKKLPVKMQNIFARRTLHTMFRSTGGGTFYDSYACNREHYTILAPSARAPCQIFNANNISLYLVASRVSKVFSLSAFQVFSGAQVNWRRDVDFIKTRRN